MWQLGAIPRPTGQMGKQGQIFVCRHRFFFDEMVFVQVYRFVVHKGRCDGKSGYQP